MEDLSLHILDVAENSTAAGASLVEITIAEDATADRLEIRIKDDGCGMDAAMTAAAVHPFVTTRTTRRVGLGLPLLKMAAEEADGTLSITSAPNVGTEVVATFRLSHVDRKPLGDVAGTILALIAGHPRTDFAFTHTRDGGTIELDTRELREQLGGVPLTAPAVLGLIRRHLEGATAERNGENHG